MDPQLISVWLKICSDTVMQTTLLAYPDSNLNFDNLTPAALCKKRGRPCENYTACYAQGRPCIVGFWECHLIFVRLPGLTYISAIQTLQTMTQLSLHTRSIASAAFFFLAKLIALVSHHICYSITVISRGWDRTKNSTSLFGSSLV